MARDSETREVTIAPVGLDGSLHIPRGAHAVVAFAHAARWFARYLAA